MKTDTERELPDIAEWINHGRRQHDAAPVWQEERSARKETNWKRIGIMAIFAAAVAFGLYAGTIAAFPAMEDKENMILYTVREGDTLWDIAKHAVGEKQDVREAYSNIMEDNHIARDAVIRPGQVLRLKRHAAQ